MGEEVNVLDPQYELKIGDSRQVLKEIPERSVDAIITSPPYWGLRSYKATPLIWDGVEGCQHEWGSEVTAEYKNNFDSFNDYRKEGMPKGGSHAVKDATRSSYNFCLKCGAWRGQLGSEPDPDLFISHLCGIFDLCKLVLKKTGSLFINIDDSMAGSWGNMSHKPAKDYPEGKPVMASTRIPAKSLCAIPERFVLEMLRRGWIYRQTIVWQKLSCMPESVKDRCTRDFEYLYHFTLQQKYFYERQFEPAESWGTRDRSNFRNGTDDPLLQQHGLDQDTSSLGRNKRSVWQINPEPQKAVKKGAVAHYAAFPTALCTTPILATVPSQICTKCGKPRVKVYEPSPEYAEKLKGSWTKDTDADKQLRSEIGYVAHDKTEACTMDYREIGLSDCGCGEKFVSGVVLDPFAGTGTVAVEARKLGRRAILIEVSPEYAELIQLRLSSIPVPMNL